ncbi:oxygenase MpaB family protein, partial [Micromonospora sp. NPDC003241]
MPDHAVTERVRLRPLIVEAAGRLAAADVASPLPDAENLAAHVLGVDRMRLALHPMIEPAEAARFAELVDRRSARIPLQHLTGTWKVWAAPTALIGFQRAVTLEHFDPFLTAAVADSHGIYDNPATRLDHTLSYFLLVALGDGRTAIQAAEHLMKVHAPMTGIEPISGKRYSANNPDSQLWIHVTGWHSVLKAYEMFGPGPLSPAEEDRYWAECVIAAELQTCKPEDVPRNRDEVRAYFARVRPQLCVSERAVRAMHFLLWPSADKGMTFAVGGRVLSLATISTLPAWMRKLGRFDLPGIVDASARLPWKALVWATALRGNRGLILASPFVA